MIDNIFLLSDIHFGVKNNSLEFLSIQEDYFNNFFIPLLKEHKNDNSALFILGDLFDNRNHINLRVMNTAIDILKSIANVIPIYILIGNHDIFQNSSNEISSVRIFENFNNIKIIQDYQLFTFSDKKILALSWLNSSTELQKEYEYVRNNNINYLFCHADFLNVNYNKFTKTTDGIDIPKDNQVKIFSGHIHWRQESNNIYIIGNPYHLNKNDIGNTKGIYHINLLDDKISFYENDYSPQYYKVTLKDIEEQKINIENNFIEIELGEDEFNKDLVKQFSESKARKIEFTIKKEENDLESEEEVNYNDDILSSLKSYINSLDINKNQKKKTYTRIKDIYSSVE